MGTLIVNGVTYKVGSNASVSITNDTVIINNKIAGSIKGRNIKVTLNGKVKLLQATDGDIVVSGDVHGNVDAGGSVRAQAIHGSVDAGGSVQTKSIGGDADAGGSITATTIKGDADAGGSICYSR
ncbi:MAG: hypothetical protein LBK71_02400 [Verrucomicrobiales bacterium]|jgi:hypothetical protein|nr:hypothetical protein [Verrucomicrobiales bacterium]